MNDNQTNDNQMSDDQMQPSLQVVEMLSAFQVPPLSEDFNFRLNERWHAEKWLARQRSRHMRWIALSGLAASVCIAGVVFWSVMASPAVAWADVAGAFNRIDQFSVILSTADDAGSKTIEIHYTPTDTWRIDIADENPSILILNPANGDGLYRIRDRKWERRGDKINLPDFTGITESLKRTELLDLLLEHFFKGDRPVLNPVLSSVSGAERDMLVFDYTADPSEGQVRIWVLKNSRLPVRMRLLKPSENRITWIDFDYSDPQQK